MSSVSLGGITLDGRVDGPTVDLDVPDYLYPRTTLPLLDVHQLTTFQSSWKYNMLTFLGDLYWTLPGLKHIQLTVKVKFGEFQGPTSTTWLRVENPDIQAKVRSMVANVFALPKVHVDLDVLLYKKEIR